MPSSLPETAPSGAPPEALPPSPEGESPSVALTPRRSKRPAWDPSTRKKPLAPWEYAFAAWLLRQPRNPPQADQVAMAQELAQKAVSYNTLRLLKHCPQFEAYVERLLEKQRKAAERAFDMQAGDAVDAHFDGMREARSRRDYKALPAFTVPILDRVKPKRAEPTTQAPQVVINLTQEQLRVVQAPPPAVESEVVEVQAEFVE